MFDSNRTKMKTAIIPNFTGKRWLKLTCRTAHLVGFAGVFASTIIEQSQIIYWVITIISGLGLLALEALSNLFWFVQIRAVVMYIKFALLYGLFVYPQHAWGILVTMILLSGFISHAPSSVRYFSLLHMKKINSDNDIKG